MADSPRQPGAARRIIRRFVASTAFQRRFWFAAASLTTHGIAVGVVLYLVDWAVPSLNTTALWIGLSWLGVVLLWHLVHRGMSLPAADGAFGLQDRLRTWWALRNAAADSADRGAVAWLEQDLSSSLAALPAATRGQLWRRPVRRLLWLLPLLLVVWILGPLGRQLILPSPFGVTEQAKLAPKAEQKPKSGAQEVAKPDRPQARKPPEKPDPKPQPKPKPKPKTPDPKPKPSGPEEPPPKRDEPEDLAPQPILPLPAQESFVIPDFVGDGATKKKRVRVAELEETAQPGRRDPSAPEPAGGPVPAAEREQKLREFRRAAERAQQSRHVPPAERSIVQRYFEALVTPPPPPPPKKETPAAPDSAGEAKPGAGKPGGGKR